MPSSRRFSEIIAIPALMAWRTFLAAIVFPCHRHGYPRLMRVRAEDGPPQLRAARPLQPGKADDLAPAHGRS